jgi:tRNA threonylcarbamoyl adenosine modification protein YeaZ
VALADAAGAVLAEAVEESTGRGTSAFGLIEQALSVAQLTREAVAVVAVGLGPGSYTGIRAAIAVAQGWQLARETRLWGITSMQSLAAQAQLAQVFGRVNLVVDAQRDEFYLGEWDIAVNSRRELAPLRIVPAAELLTRQAAGEICVGPEMKHRLFPTAATVANLAAGCQEWVPGDQLEPVYLRATTFVKAAVGRREF